MKATRALLSLLVVFLLAAATVRADDGEEKPASSTGGLRSEEDVEKLREEAIQNLQMPLEKMKVKELKALLTERGVVCNACAEKEQLIKTVRESMHLPIKKDHLKKMHIPKQPQDEELDNILKELKKKQEKDNKMKEQLEAAGINTAGMNFGGMNGIDMESLVKKMKKDKDL